MKIKIGKAPKKSCLFKVLLLVAQCKWFMRLKSNCFVIVRDQNYCQKYQKNIFGLAGLAWAGMGWHGLAWAGMGLELGWHGLGAGLVWSGMGWHWLEWGGWAGMGWNGRVWAGMVWYGLVWAGMVWYGLAWARGKYFVWLRF